MKRQEFKTVKQLDRAFSKVPADKEWEFLLLHKDYVEVLTIDNDMTNITWTLGDEEDDKYNGMEDYIGSSFGAYNLLKTLGFNVEFC